MYNPINRCCLYPQALFVSDLFSLDEKYLVDFMYADELPTTVHYQSEMEWPQQGRPSKTS
eukprot:4622567-Ditylum_brightwellii.AAC.1